MRPGSFRRSRGSSKSSPASDTLAKSETPPCRHYDTHHQRRLRFQARNLRHRTILDRPLPVRRRDNSGEESASAPRRFHEMAPGLADYQIHRPRGNTELQTLDSGTSGSAATAAKNRDESQRTLRYVAPDSTPR